MNTELEIAQAHLDSLLAELETIQAYYAQESAMRERQHALRGSLGIGEIALARRVVRDCQFPILRPKKGLNYWSRNLRVVSVTDKMVGVREDEMDDKDIRWYRRENGWRKGTKSNYDTIDIAKALQLWEQFQAQQKAIPV